MLSSFPILDAGNISSIPYHSIAGEQFFNCWISPSCAPRRDDVAEEFALGKGHGQWQVRKPHGLCSWMGTLYRCWELPKSVAYTMVKNKWSQQGHQMPDVISLKGLLLRKLHRLICFGGWCHSSRHPIAPRSKLQTCTGSAGEPHVHPLLVPCFDPCSYGDWSTFTANKNQSWEWVLRIAVEFWGQMQYPIFTHAHIIPYKHHLPAGTNIQH